MTQPYDVNAIFADMEADLIASYRRNIARHAVEEVKEGFSWPMWQQKKLADLRQYKKEARILINKSVNRAVRASDGMLVDTYNTGKRFSNSIIKKLYSGVGEASFGKIDRRKVDAMLDAVSNDFRKAGSAALRLVDDEYRQIVFKTQVKFASGVTTLGQAIDLAAKDFLSNGINCIRYKNGNMVNIASYAEAVLRASNKRAYLTGEGARNAELGIHLVQVTSYGACSDICLPWQGRVYVDDVYSGGTQKDGPYPLLSMAMSNGLFHPNCRHTSQPFFEGISSAPIPSKTESEIQETYQAEQRQREIERNIRKYKRIEAGSVDPQNQARAGQKVRDWQAEMRRHIGNNDFLRRDYRREKVL